MKNSQLRTLTSLLIGRLSTYTGQCHFFQNAELKKKKKELVDGCKTTLETVLQGLKGVDDESDVSVEMAKTTLKQLRDPLRTLQDMEAHEERLLGIRHFSYEQNRELKQGMLEAFFNRTLRQSTVRRLTENCLADLKSFARNNHLVDPIEIQHGETAGLEGQVHQQPGMQTSQRRVV